MANFHHEAPLPSFPYNKVRWVHMKLGNSFFELINACMYVSLAALGLHCCTQAFSSPGPGVTQASHCSGFSCRAWTLEHVGSVVMDSTLSCSVACGILLAQESNLRSPALTGEFLTTGPPEVPGQIFNWTDSRIIVNAKQRYFRLFIARHRKLTRDTEWHSAYCLAQC